MPGPRRSGEFFEYAWNRAQYFVAVMLYGRHMNSPHSGSYEKIHSLTADPTDWSSLADMFRGLVQLL
jgi:hypothetical protein